MHVEVLGGVEIADHVRAYAEYRLFSTLARFGRAVLGVRVTIERHESRDSAPDVACSVAVQLDPCGTANLRAMGRHPHEAIDRAAGRIGRLLDKRTARHPSS